MTLTIQMHFVGTLHRKKNYTSIRRSQVSTKQELHFQGTSYKIEPAWWKKVFRRACSC